MKEWPRTSDQGLIWGPIRGLLGFLLEPSGKGDGLLRMLGQFLELTIPLGYMLGRSKYTFNISAFGCSL